MIIIIIVMIIMNIIIIIKTLSSFVIISVIIAGIFSIFWQVGFFGRALRKPSTRTQDPQPIQALSRLEYTYDGLPRHLAGSILCGVLSVQCGAMVFGLFGRLQPWFLPVI